MGNLERFAEQALPSIDKFYSEKIEIRDFGDYHDNRFEINEPN